ncbi:hypothetical protein AVEN_165900-1, partial [Araneus ventricosus]
LEQQELKRVEETANDESFSTRDNTHRLKEPHASTLPRVTFNQAQVRAEEGSPVQLPCVAQGNPPPTYSCLAGASIDVCFGDNGTTGRSVHRVLKTVHLKPAFWTREEILKTRSILFIA